MMSTRDSIENSQSVEIVHGHGARLHHLVALGVGAVISGDFFGWNLGLAQGGFGGMMVSVTVALVFFIGLIFSIAELTSVYPTGAGAYSLTQGLGPYISFLAALCQTLEYLLIPGAIVVGMGGYVTSVLGISDDYLPVVWSVLLLLLVILTCIGVSISLSASLILAATSVTILLVFYVGAFFHLDINKWAYTIPQDESAALSSTAFPNGILGTFHSLTYALWFFLGLEELPIAAGVADDPATSIPRALILSLAILGSCAFLTTFLSACIPPGAAAIGVSGEPLHLSFNAIFGDVSGKLFACLALVGLFTSAHAVTFASAKQLQVLSQLKVYPKFLSARIGGADSDTPVAAAVVTGLVSCACIQGVNLAFTDGGFDDESTSLKVGRELITLAVVGAIIIYLLQLIAFIHLRFSNEGVRAPFRSPFGIAGAIVSMILGVAVFVDEMIQAFDIGKYALVALLAWIALGFTYQAVTFRPPSDDPDEQESEGLVNSEVGAPSTRRAGPVDFHIDSSYNSSHKHVSTQDLNGGRIERTQETSATTDSRGRYDSSRYHEGDIEVI